MATSIDFRIQILDNATKEIQKIKGQTNAAFQSMNAEQKKYNMLIADTQLKILSLNKESLTASKARQKEIKNEIQTLGKLKQAQSQSLRMSGSKESIAKDNGISGSSMLNIAGGNLLASATTMALQAASAIKQFGEESITAAAKYEKYQITLKTVFGNNVEAIESMTLIQQIAAKTPFQVDQLTESYIKLVNRGFKPSEKEIVKLGDLAASQGKDFDQLTEALLDAETFQFVRLKEFGITMTKDGNTITSTFKGQKVQFERSAEAVRKYMLSLGDLKGVQGLMAAQASTYSGQVSNLNDNIDLLKTAIGERMLPTAKSFVDIQSRLVGAIKDYVQVPLTEKLIEQKAEFNATATALQYYNKDSEEHKTLVAELVAAYPEYASQIIKETTEYGKLSESLRLVNTELDRKIKLEGQKEALGAVQSDIKRIEGYNVAMAKISSLQQAGQKDLAERATADLVKQMGLDELSLGNVGNVAQLSGFGSVADYLKEENLRISKLKGSKGLSALQSEVNKGAVVDEINSIAGQIIGKNAGKDKTIKTVNDLKTSLLKLAKEGKNDSKEYKELFTKLTNMNVSTGGGSKKEPDKWATELEAKTTGNLQFILGKMGKITTEQQKVLDTDKSDLTKILETFKANENVKGYKETSQYTYLKNVFDEKMKRIEDISQGKLDNGLSTELSTQKSVKNLTLNISKVVGVETMTTNNIQESSNVIGQYVLNALNRSIMDINTHSQFE